MSSGSFVGSDSPATAARASRSEGGNSLSRLAARRRIPWQAVGLKKYFRGGLDSSTRDKEEATAPLGDSEVLRVQHAPDAPALRADADASGAPSVIWDDRPEAGEFAEDDGEVFSSLARQKAVDVLKEKPTGSERISEANELVEESGALAIQARTASSHREVLAWAASSEKSNGCELRRVYPFHVSEAWNVRPVVREDTVTRGVILNLPRAAEARLLKSEV